MEERQDDLSSNWTWLLPSCYIPKVFADGGNLLKAANDYLWMMSPLHFSWNNHSALQQDSFFGWLKLWEVQSFPITVLPKLHIHHHLGHTHLDRSCSKSWTRDSASQREDMCSLSSAGMEVPSINQRSRRDFLLETEIAFRVCFILDMHVGHQDASRQMSSSLKPMHMYTYMYLLLCLFSHTLIYSPIQMTFHVKL